jgi:hypothetical protein
MKKLILMLSLAMFFCVAGTSFASTKQKAPNVKAVESANENAIFNRAGDWFSTIGKSKEDKMRIKAERKAKRKAKKMEKKVRKQAELAGEDLEVNKGALKEEGKQKEKRMKKKVKKNKMQERKGSVKKGS